jgi:hypothetical protein
MTTVPGYGNAEKPKRGSRNPLTIIIVGVVFLIGVGGVFALGYFFPASQLVTIVIGVFVLIGIVGGMRAIMGNFWAYIYTTPFVAFALLGAAFLGEDMALAKVGEPTEVVVVEDHLEQKTERDSSGSHQVYTHEYTLEHTDGTPVDELMIYRGKEGYDSFDEGDTITVLLDPAGEAPAQPADEVDVDSDIGVIVLGVVTSGIVFFICLIVVIFRWTRSRPQHVR